MAQVKRKGLVRVGQRKHRQKSYRALKQDLDRIFSVWVRRRWADKSGKVPCVCCGAVKHWKDMQAGHYMARHYLNTRWTADNVNPCCMACNVFKKGNYPAYSLWLVKTYGVKILSRLQDFAREPVKYSRADLQALILEYEERVRELDYPH